MKNTSSIWWKRRNTSGSFDSFWENLSYKSYQFFEQFPDDFAKFYEDFKNLI